MKKLIILIILLSLYNLCFCQNPKPKIDPEAKYQEQIKNRARLSLEVLRISASWRLFMFGDMSRGMSNLGALDYFEEYISEGRPNHDPAFNLSELLYLRNNKNEIRLFLKDFDYFGSEKSVFAADRMPLSIIQTDTGKVFFLSGLFTNKIFNTLKLSSRQRAAKVLSSGLIEKLGTMNEMITDKTIKYFAIGAVYGSKSFAESDIVLPDPEYVFIISPRSLIIKYTLGTITEDEFLNRSSIFLSDSDKQNVKVKIVME